MWKNCVNLIEINFDVHAILFNPYRWIFETVTECDLKKNPKSLFVTSQLGLRNEKLYVQIDCRMWYIMKLLSNGICQFFGKCHSEKKYTPIFGTSAKNQLGHDSILMHMHTRDLSLSQPFWAILTTPVYPMFFQNHLKRGNSLYKIPFPNEFAILQRHC